MIVSLVHHWDYCWLVCKQSMVNLIIPIKFINVVCKLACSGLFRIFARKAKKTLKGCRRFAAHRLNLNCCELVGFGRGCYHAEPFHEHCSWCNWIANGPQPHPRIHFKQFYVISRNFKDLLSNFKQFERILRDFRIFLTNLKKWK